ncbi:SDR family NAD(P)-dependent oxidoreductase [Streptomyces europaeiscabiei]|uniref:SDR family NAD(P)-dependent oxidoreductase n=1 Tax=Streptomyces europaeiscabiei TaxID=146819 RepID=UPI002E2984D3|nr:SDR family NAD(P)-dependent oxidoreductase [Streptomyces europaeiscabiei]
MPLLPASPRRRPPLPWLRRGTHPSGWRYADVPQLTGLTAVVTGASSGVGLALAEQLAAREAHVVLVARGADETGAAARSLCLRGRVSAVPVDLADLDDVRTAARRIRELTDGRVDLLVNNAGVAALPPTCTPSGFEAHFAVNHLGHYALTGHLMPALLAAPAPRVVTVSSVLHWLGRLDPVTPHRPARYHRWGAYFASKAANLVFTHGLDTWARAARAPLTAVSAHPGLVHTSLGSRALREAGRHTEARLLEHLQRRWHSPAEAALPLLRASTDPAAQGGDFFGPGGYLELSGPAVHVRAAPSTASAAAADRLWRMSKQLTGIAYPAAPPAPHKPDHSTGP